MVFNTGAALLDAIVLAVVSEEKEGTYGYKITQEVRAVLDVSESTLYPVLRRLLKDGCLEVYDMEYGGRNRRYYKITESGRRQLPTDGRSSPHPASSGRPPGRPGLLPSHRPRRPSRSRPAAGPTRPVPASRASPRRRIKPWERH